MQEQNKTRRDVGTNVHYTYVYICKLNLNLRFYFNLEAAKASTEKLKW